MVIVLDWVKWWWCHTIIHNLIQFLLLVLFSWRWGRTWPIARAHMRDLLIFRSASINIRCFLSIDSITTQAGHSTTIDHRKINACEWYIHNNHFLLLFCSWIGSLMFSFGLITFCIISIVCHTYLACRICGLCIVTTLARSLLILDRWLWVVNTHVTWPVVSLYDDSTFGYLVFVAEHTLACNSRHSAMLLTEPNHT